MQNSKRDENSLRLLCMNLRYDRPDNGLRSWKKRCPLFIKLINELSPDFICTQEGFAHQILDLLSDLPQYRHIGKERSGSGRDEYCTIFYRADAWTCEENITVALSETPENLGSRSWNSSLPRIAVAARFVSSVGPKKIGLINTHFDHESEWARIESAKFIKNLHKSFLGYDNPLVVAGDFNAEPESEARKILRGELHGYPKWHDDFYFSQEKTFHDFTGQAFSARDTILAYPWNKAASRVIKYHEGDTWISDHHPLLLDLKWPPVKEN